MAGFQTATMPRPQSRARPATPVVDIALVRPEQAAAAPEAPRKRISAHPCRRRMTPEQRAHVRKRAAEGWPHTAIAAEVGFGPTAIWAATRDIERVAGAAMKAVRKEAREEAQAEVQLLKSRGLSDREIARRLKMSRSNVARLKLSPDEYEQYLSDLLEKYKQRAARKRAANGGLRQNFLEPIARAVNVATSIGLDELKTADAGQPRPPGFVRVRQIVCWIAVTDRGCSFRQVGRELGIDHSTVRNAVRIVQAAADTIDLRPLRRMHQRITALIAAMRRDAAGPEIPTP